MHRYTSQLSNVTDVRTPRRNRYHFGQLLGVEQFELETDYANQKRWLLNRLVSGYGVVCGLDVEPGDDPYTIVITSGIAIDHWGRELVVPQNMDPIEIPTQHVTQGAKMQSHRPKSDNAHAWVHVVLCYHECESDPVPVMAGDCHNAEPCAPSTIREVCCVEFRPGPIDAPDVECHIPDVIANSRIDYDALARWVTRGCPETQDDPCIPLANIRIINAEKGHDCNPNNIDIAIRPIVYTNDLLFELLLGLRQSHGPDKKWK